MNWNDKQKVSIATLDLNKGHENQGMRCIREIISRWGKENSFEVTTKEFEVRLNNEVPGTDFDVYISSGGPGSPLESEGSEWEKRYFNWLQQIENWNNNQANFKKKYVFFICHSFQLVSRHYKIGNVCKRKSTSFGVFPIHMMKSGTQELVFEGLNNPFYAVDSRDYQLIEPDNTRLKKMGAKILALEKERPHVPYERAVMSIRFNDYFIGTQFHPEADATGMSMYLQREDKKKTVIENYGEDKWLSMIEHLNDPEKIRWTYSHILPNFLNEAVNTLVEA
ncbi:MAG: GMP synthase [Segetibacter sp.]|jgi:GMP synthase-like glutamine amidotransferase|nr:GMP synthase [Segetibacter sp.]